MGFFLVSCYSCTFLLTEVFSPLVMHQETHREAGMVTFKKGGKDSSQDWKNQDFIASYRVTNDWFSYFAILGVTASSYIFSIVILTA